MNLLSILGVILLVVGVVWLATGSVIGGVVCIVVGLVLYGSGSGRLRL